MILLHWADAPAVDEEIVRRNGNAAPQIVATCGTEGVVVAVTVLFAATNTPSSSPNAKPVQATAASVMLPEVVQENPLTPDITVLADTVGA